MSSPFYEEFAEKYGVDVPERPDVESATSLLPPVRRPSPGQPRSTFAHPDGSTYVRPDPDEFESFDQVNSLLIIDDGAPD